MWQYLNIRRYKQLKWNMVIWFDFWSKHLLPECPISVAKPLLWEWCPGGWKYAALSRKSFKELPPLVSLSQVSLREREASWGIFDGSFAIMKTMSNVLSMRRGEGNILDQRLANLRSSCLQSNISSLSSILLSPHILRKASFELWDERETEKHQPEYHSREKPWILERAPVNRRDRATEELPSTPTSSFSSTRRFSWHGDQRRQWQDYTMTWWQDELQVLLLLDHHLHLCLCHLLRRPCLPLSGWSLRSCRCSSIKLNNFLFF